MTTLDNNSRPRRSLQSSEDTHVTGLIYNDDSGFHPDKNTARTIGIVAGALVFIIIAVVACVICIRKKTNNGWRRGLRTTADMSFSDSQRDFLGIETCFFEYHELAAATNGFSEENMLGEGGFGKVYRGVLSNGKEVAVKCLKPGGKQRDRQFHAEVKTLGRLHHRNIVSLVGYCVAPGKRLLVYPYIPNGTLEQHLHGNNAKALDFQRRLNIAIGTAKGLQYLHEDSQPRIIHRDIKCANILLDDNFEAKVADFGLAKLTGETPTSQLSNSTAMGTRGYMAPEYQELGRVNEKADTYAFGVVLLELLTGRRAIHDENASPNLADWARPLIKRILDDGNYSMVVDPELGTNYNRMAMGRLLACALAGIRRGDNTRPKMSLMVRTLEGGSTVELNNPLAEHVMRVDSGRE